MLDTHGMVCYQRGEFSRAADDFRRSVRGGPTAVKNFHLALAELAVGNTGDAVTAWRDAQLRGLDEESLSQGERALLAKLKAGLPKEEEAAVSTSSDGSQP